MPLASSGNLSLKTTAGVDRNISCCVDGNSTGDKSLSALSVCAKKTAPHCMREFYGFQATCFYFGVPQIITCNTNCWDVWFPVCLIAVENEFIDVFTVNFSWQADLSTSGSVVFQTKENTGLWITRDSQTAGLGSGTFTVTNITDTDALCGRINLNIPDPQTGNAGLLLDDPPATQTSGSGEVFRCAPYETYVTLPNA